MSFAHWKAWPLHKWLLWPDPQTLWIIQCHRLQLGTVLLLLATTCAIWSMWDLKLALGWEVGSLVVVKQSCNKVRWNCHILTGDIRNLPSYKIENKKQKLCNKRGITPPSSDYGDCSRDAWHAWLCPQQAAACLQLAVVCGWKEPSGAFQLPSEGRLVS